MHRSRRDRCQAVSLSLRARTAILVVCSLVLPPAGAVALAGGASAEPVGSSQITPSAGATIGGQTVTITGTEHVAETVAQSVGGHWAISEDGLLYDLNLGGDVPFEALADTTVQQVSSSGLHTLALTSSGDVLSWGHNAQGQLGDGTQTNRPAPIVVDFGAHLGDSSVTSIVAGTNHSLALTDDGRIFGWGSNTNGQLGTGDTTRALHPVPADTSSIPDGRTVTSIDTAQVHSAAVLDDGSVYGWGNNFNGQLGLGNWTTSLVPTHMTRTGPGGLVVEQVALGYYNSLVRTADGTVHATGYGFYGQNGTGVDGAMANTRSLTPVSTAGVLDGARVVDIAAEGHRVNAVLEDGTAVGWGRSYLGNGVVDGPFSAPVAVDTSGALAGAHLTRVTMVSNGTYALAADGSVYSWGGGVFAGGSAVPVISPPLVAPLTVAFGSPDHTGADVSYDRASKELRALTPARSPGTVEVTVARSAAPTVSAAAGEFTFGSPPVVTTHPLSQVVESGTSVRLEVAADGDTAPDVLWQTSLDGRTWETVTDGVLTESHPTTVVDGAVVPGTTTSTVDLTATAPRLSVRAVLDNGSGDPVESDVAVVRLTNPPVALDSHQDGGPSDAMPLVHGLGTPGATVTVTVDGARAAEAVVGDHGHWLARIPSPWI